MRVGDIHEPQAGAHVTKMCIESDRRHGDTTTLLRIRYVDDGRRDEEETPDNTTADDEDDHSDEEKAR